MNAEERAFLEFITPMINENRQVLLRDVLQKRSRYLTVVLEDIYQPQNASAVLRTCDCFGIQDVHVIENKNEYVLNPEVELGAAQWLNIYKYNDSEENTLKAIQNLKAEGYRIVATTPHTNDVVLEEFDLAKGKAAIMFGTERQGLSKLALEHADEYLRIPMIGFTESFNISVSAAIILHHLNLKLRNLPNWALSEEEKEDVYFKWMKNSVHKIHQIEHAFKKKYRS